MMTCTNLRNFAWTLALPLAVVVNGPVAAPAIAYDGLRGSYVPVPAPNPLPEHRAKWYFRVDGGIGFNASPSGSESGARYGETDSPGTTGPNPFGFRGSSFNSISEAVSGDENVSISFGAGHYVSPNWRIDFTAEYRSNKKLTLTGDYSYQKHEFSGAPATYGAVTPDREVRGNVTENLKQRSSIFMANTYYDVATLGNWKPYIGGGIGFAFTELSRSYSASTAECDPNQTPVPCGTLTTTSTTNESDKHYNLALAASLSAGMSYRVTESASLDFNYRYLYVGGSESSLTINGNASEFKLDASHEHYLRAGLRFDIN